jgi:hypothetical protein
MITAKHTRCQRFCWAYVTRFPGVTTTQISSIDYSPEEIGAALRALVLLGYIEQDGQHLWRAVVPFVVEVPRWAI